MPMFHGHGLKSALLVPLASGSGVICSHGFDIPAFFRQLVELRPTWYSAAASIHHAVLQRVDEHRDAVRAGRVRFIRSGSARLDPRVMAGLEDAFSAPVVERYGMTETCTLTSNPLPPEERRPGSVGRPMFNEVAIIDESGDVVSPGCVGEVVARGPGVFDGYLDDPLQRLPHSSTAGFVPATWAGSTRRISDDGRARQRTSSIGAARRSVRSKWRRHCCAIQRWPRRASFRYRIPRWVKKWRPRWLLRPICVSPNGSCVRMRRRC